jgi:hypothetical protein
MAISAGLQAQLNKVNCGASGVLGTGTSNCPFNRKRVIATILTTQGFEFEEALSLAYLQELQQRGVAIVLGKVISFADNTPEDSINTYDTTGIKSINGKRPYEYVCTFDNGLYFHKALNSLESFGAYDVTYVDEALNILMTSTSTSVKGLTLGQVGSGKYIGATGNAPSSESLWWQELYRSEFDVDATWVTSANHDIRATNLEGVNDAVVEFAVIPSDGDVTVQFSVKTKADVKDIPLSGLVAGDVEIIIDGVSKTPSGITQNTTTKVWTATFTGAVGTGDVCTVRLNDSDFTTGIILKGGKLYKSNTASATAVA